MTIHLTGTVWARLVELFANPARQAQNIRLYADRVSPEGICFGRVPGVRLWFWGQVAGDRLEIIRVWPENPFPEII